MRASRGVGCLLPGALATAPSPALIWPQLPPLPSALPVPLFTLVAELEPHCCAGCPRHRLTPFLLAWGATQAAKGLGQLLHLQTASVHGLPEQDCRLSGLPKRHSPSYSSGG